MTFTFRKGEELIRGDRSIVPIADRPYSFCKTEFGSIVHAVGLGGASLIDSGEADRIDSSLLQNANWPTRFAILLSWEPTTSGPRRCSGARHGEAIVLKKPCDCRRFPFDFKREAQRFRGQSRLRAVSSCDEATRHECARCSSRILRRLWRLLERLSAQC